MATVIQLRHDTTANWTSSNPTLAPGEFGYDTTLGQHKVGNGSTPWLSLPFYGVGVTGATGPARPAGQVLINFGSSWAGTNETKVDISDTNILSTSIPTVSIAAVATSDHTVEDHTYMAAFIHLSCSAPTVGVGFTIYAFSTEKLSGTYTVNYTWS